MSEKLGELEKLSAIATDMELSIDLRTKAIELLGNIGSHNALLALLALAADEKLDVSTRDLALKKARDIIKAGH
jgi:HEAT repeat protein|tara:strand:- start:76 stop:297 length:222 start_codon:yes stop_codon:yes gene_type:complete